MTLFEIINFCKNNNFHDFIENLENLKESDKEQMSDEEREAINLSIQAAENMQFCFIKHFDSFEVSIYKQKEELVDSDREIEFTVQILFITANGNTIPDGVNINKELLEKINEDELIKLIGNLIFKVLANYGKMVGLKLLQTKKQIKENINLMN